MATKRKAARKAAGKAGARKAARKGLRALALATTPRPGGRKRKREAVTGTWVTSHNEKPLYKVLTQGGSARNGGHMRYGRDPVGKVFEWDGRGAYGDGYVQPDKCSAGLHLTNSPEEWGGFDLESTKPNRTFLAAYWLGNGEEKSYWVDGAEDDTFGDDKVACRKIKILAEVKPIIVKQAKAGKVELKVTKPVQGVYRWGIPGRGAKLLTKKDLALGCTYGAELGKAESEIADLTWESNDEGWVNEDE